MKPSVPRALRVTRVTDVTVEAVESRRAELEGPHRSPQRSVRLPERDARQLRHVELVSFRAGPRRVAVPGNAKWRGALWATDPHRDVHTSRVADAAPVRVRFGQMSPIRRYRRLSSTVLP